jgi:HSP20 family protein
MAVMQQTRRPRSPMGSPMGSRWEPPRDFDDLQARLSQLMEGAFAGVGLSPDSVWVPLVDIEETEDAWILEAEVPGVKRDDINVEVRDSEVLVTGEIKEKERTGLLRRRTRPVGRFEYRVELPGDVKPDEIDASLDDGVLTLRIPKAEKARPRRIEIGSHQLGNGSRKQSGDGSETTAQAGQTAGTTAA